jgi:hypothetical protein
VADWWERQQQLGALAQRRLFFVGGAGILFAVGEKTPESAFLFPRDILTPEMNQVILAQLGWMFPHFGWRP